MAGSSNQRSRREREAERQRAEAEAMQAAYDRARRRRAAVGIGVVAVVIVAVIGAIYAATSSKRSTTSSGATTTTAVANTVALPTVAPGQTLTGAAPCPAADGSSPRTTEFSQPPPICLDPAKQYSGEIVTSVGTMHFSLDTVQYPQAANTFAFLAGYHYYDGLPISQIQPAAYAVVDNPVNANGQPGPGFSIPNEAATRGPVLSSLTIALVPSPDGTVGGAFLSGLTGQFAQIPPNAPQVGTILDDRLDPKQTEPDPNVRQSINKAATPSGAPSQVVTITTVTVTAR